MQSKKDTHKEVLLNNILGVLVGLVAIRLLVPIVKEFDPTLQSFIIVGVMFFLSYTRGYVLRRFFNKRSK